MIWNLIHICTANPVLFLPCDIGCMPKTVYTANQPGHNVFNSLQLKDLGLCKYHCHSHMTVCMRVVAAANAILWYMQCLTYNLHISDCLSTYPHKPKSSVQMQPIQWPWSIWSHKMTLGVQVKQSTKYKLMPHCAIWDIYTALLLTCTGILNCAWNGCAWDSLVALKDFIKLWLTELRCRWLMSKSTANKGSTPSRFSKEQISSHIHNWISQLWKQRSVKAKPKNTRKARSTHDKKIYFL